MTGRSTGMCWPSCGASGPRVRGGCWRAAPAWERWWPGGWTGESSAAGGASCCMRIGGGWMGRGRGGGSGGPRRAAAGARGGVGRDLQRDGRQAGDLRVRLVHAELSRYLENAHGALADVLIANAVLDLVDVPSVLPGLLRLLVPGGVYWFTINYDGETIFEPGHPLDDQVIRAYHRDMDERIRYGRPAGESRTGRLRFP